MENPQPFSCGHAQRAWQKRKGRAKLAATIQHLKFFMKRKTTVFAALLVAAGALYLTFKPHQQDPHYYAAACVVINDLHGAASKAEFVEKLQEVIINENSSYAVDKVAFDAKSAQGAFQRYQQLSEQNKSRARQGINGCLSVMLPPSAR